MTKRVDNLIRLQTHPAGVGGALRSVLARGRTELVTNGPNKEFTFIGSDPWDTNAYTGLVVPATPSSANSDARYLFLLARASFRSGEQSPEKCGVRLVGIRQYAELIARLPAREGILDSESGPPTGATVVFRKEITTPLWHFPDGNISWHVVIVNVVSRDMRNPANTDGFNYQDCNSPTLLYQSGAPSGVGYVPPNGGRPWGTPLDASLGNIHELRYPWRTNRSERALDIPIPTPCDVLLFASVRQNDPATNPTLDSDAAASCAIFGALSPEDQFMVAFNNLAQYGTVAGSLVFDENLGRSVP
jgi:hypothetical protein